MLDPPFNLQVTVLWSQAGLFERVIHDQLYSYFEDNHLISESQYGFRNKYSTELACLELTDKFDGLRDTNKIPIEIFLDQKPLIH